MLNTEAIDRLKAQLLTSNLSQTNHPLFQIINQLIDADRRFQLATIAAIDAAVPSSATFLTATDQTPSLPNSRELLAGTNVSFNDTVANRRTINVASTGITQLTGDVTAGPGTGSQVAIVAAVNLAVATLTGDLPDVNLSANVPLLNVVNTFTAGGAHTWSAASASANWLKVRNTTNGAGAIAGVFIGNDINANMGGFIGFSSGYTTAGPQFANGMEFQAAEAGGISISSYHVSGTIRHYTNGVLRSTIGATGLYEFQSTRTQIMLINSTHADGGYIDVNTSGSPVFSIGSAKAIGFAGAAATDAGMYGPGWFTLGSGSGTRFANNTVTQVTLASTGVWRWHVYGAGTITSDASGNLTAVSDERMKADILPFNLGLRSILAIQPISYKYNRASGLDMINRYVGFSAQQVKQFIPQAVGINLRGEYTLNDKPILAAVVNSIKTLQDEIDEIRAFILLGLKPRAITPRIDEDDLIKSIPDLVITDEPIEPKIEE